MKIIGSYKIHSIVEKIKSVNESLDPELEKRLRFDLKKYCTAAGKDYIEICKLAGLSTEGIENISDKLVEIIEEYARGPWSYDDTTGRVNIEGDFRVDGWSAQREARNIEKELSGVKFGKISGDFVISALSELGDTTLDSMCPLEVSGNYTVQSAGLTKCIIPPKVEKNINLSNNEILKLENFPNVVKGSVWVNNNRLNSLEGSPEKVEGSFSFSSQRPLEGGFSLKGSPIEVGEDFTGENNKIQSMEGCPEVINGSLKLNENLLLDLVGNLKRVGGSVKVERNRLATLEGLPLGKSSYNIDCSKNLIPPAVLKSTYKDASNLKSWLAAYLKLSATDRFKRMGKAERDPIRDRITPEIIAKSPVSIAPVWKDSDLMNDPVVKRLIKKSGINNNDVFKSAADTSSDLSDLGF